RERAAQVCIAVPVDEDALRRKGAAQRVAEDFAKPLERVVPHRLPARTRQLAAEGTVHETHDEVATVRTHDELERFRGATLREHEAVAQSVEDVALEAQRDLVA